MNEYPETTKKIGAQSFLFKERTEFSSCCVRKHGGFAYNPADKVLEQ